MQIEWVNVLGRSFQKFPWSYACFSLHGLHVNNDSNHKGFTVREALDETLLNPDSQEKEELLEFDVEFHFLFGLYVQPF